MDSFMDQRKWWTSRLLKVDNVYLDPVSGIIRDQIYFPKEIRKGKKKSVSVPVTQKLRSYLERYQPPESGYLFPSPRNPDQPISYEAIYKYLKKTVEQAGLSHQKIATHSGRRSWVTQAYKSGMTLEAIRQITGHLTLSSLQRYIDTDQEYLLEAMENVPV